MSLTDLQKIIINNRINKDRLEKEYNNNISYVINSRWDIVLKYLPKLPDVNIASKLILDAIKNNKKIIVCSDFDMDGGGGLAVSRYFFKEIYNYSNNVFYIVGGRKHGRGICGYVMDKICSIDNKQEVGLLITIDHGTTDEDKYKRIKEVYPNIKIVLTDHHTVEYDIYPNSVDAFINVHREDSEFPKVICGNQTIFLTYLHTLKVDKHNSIDNFINNTLPYVALSTIIDRMDMSYEINRVMVNLGIQYMLDKPVEDRLTILRSYINSKDRVDSRVISLEIGPLLNTANRCNAEPLLTYMLTTNNIDTYDKILNRIAELNKFRKEDKKIALANILNKLIIRPTDSSIVIITHDPKTNYGGPIASTITQMYQKPTICFECRDTHRDILIGSGRNGVDGLNALQIMRDIQEEDSSVIVSANGHKGAFGVTIYTNKLPKFRELFNKHTSKYITIDMLNKLPTPEFYTSIDDITDTWVETNIMDIGPYGLNFEYPVIGITNLILHNIWCIDTYCKVTFRSKTSNKVIEGMMFFNNPTKHKLTKDNIKHTLGIGTEVTLICNIWITNYKGKEKISYDVLDIILTHDI